jgi:hypothetical protein
MCLTTEKKARKNLSQGSRTIRIHKPAIKIHKLQYKTGIQPYIDKKIEPKEHERM